MTIYKYKLKVTDRQFVDMPTGAIILTVQVQRGDPHLWAGVEEGGFPNARLIRIFGTGQPMGSEPMVYIGTFQLYEKMPLVFHVFEEMV
jgi:hypothetical protein